MQWVGINVAFRINIISQWLLLDWCCIYKWKKIFFTPFNGQPCHLSLRFRSQLWDLSFWHIAPSSLGSAESRGPHPHSGSHLSCCLTEGWCRCEWWGPSAAAAQTDASLSLRNKKAHLSRPLAPVTAHWWDHTCPSFTWGTTPSVGLSDRQHATTILISSYAFW